MVSNSKLTIEAPSAQHIPRDPAGRDLFLSLARTAHRDHQRERTIARTLPAFIGGSDARIGYYRGKVFAYLLAARFADGRLSARTRNMLAREIRRVEAQPVEAL